MENHSQWFEALFIEWYYYHVLRPFSYWNFSFFYTKISASGQFLVLYIQNTPNKLSIIQSSKLNVLGRDTSKLQKTSNTMDSWHFQLKNSRNDKRWPVLLIWLVNYQLQSLCRTWAKWMHLSSTWPWQHVPRLMSFQFQASLISEHNP